MMSQAFLFPLLLKSLSSLYYLKPGAVRILSADYSKAFDKISHEVYFEGYI